MDKLTYELPSGERFQSDYDLCRGRFLLSFTLKGGLVVDAIRISTQEEVAAAYRAWMKR